MTRKRKVSLVLDPNRVPVPLYLPNLIGYLRWIFLFLFLWTPYESLGCISLLISMSLDFIDGPIARKFKMCSTFGDLNDHLCDHVTMLAAIMLTTDTNEYFGFVNVTVNAIHCIVAFFYMISRGLLFRKISITFCFRIFC